jgi:hypothetical protein
LVTDFCEEFKKNFQGKEFPAPNELMERCLVVIHEIESALFREFNLGKAETRKMMPFCKVSVEKFIFDKVAS